MSENEENRRMNIQETAAIRDDLCNMLLAEEFSQRAAKAVWNITETKTNMSDALDLKNKLSYTNVIESDVDLFFSDRMIRSFGEIKPMVAVCRCEAELKRLLNLLDGPYCINEFAAYKEVIVLTNFWSSDLFESHKNGILDFSVEGDTKTGFFLLTDYGVSKILRIS